jgi:transposase
MTARTDEATAAGGRSCCLRPAPIAIFAHVQRFGSAMHTASYAGLLPNTYQSGTGDRHGRINSSQPRQRPRPLAFVAQAFRRSLMISPAARTPL